MTTAAEKVAADTEKTIPEKRRALGRGLESLLPSGPRVLTGAASPGGGVAPGPEAGAHFVMGSHQVDRSLIVDERPCGGVGNVDEFAGIRGRVENH